MTVSAASKQPVSYIPFIWKIVGVTSGQTTPLVVNVSGISGITRFALVKEASVVSITVQLSSALTNGYLDLEITKGGSATGKTIRMNAAAGTFKRVNFVPGKLTGGPGDRLGLQWSSNGPMAPSGSINAVAFFEVQNI